MQGMKVKDKYAEHVLHFQVLQIGPSFPCLAFSCVAIWSLNFVSCIFTHRDFDGPHFQVLHFYSTRLPSRSFRAAVMSNHLPREIDIARDEPTTLKIIKIIKQINVNQLEVQFK